MIKPLVLYVLLMAASMSAAAQNDAPAVHRLPPDLHRETHSLNPDYLIFLPELQAGTRLPLVIYLHGAGGIGNDIHKIQGQPRSLWNSIRKFNKGPCIIVAPQSLKRPAQGLQAGWLPEDLNLLLRHLKSTWPIDRTRIYLTGNSMGGYGSWVWGAHNPEHFAAIAPVSGGLGRGGPKDVTPELETWAGQLATVPVFAFAGAQDKVVPAERSERMIAAIRNAGGKKARLKVYPDEAHGAGRVVYSTAELYDWMFSQQQKELNIE